MLKKRKKKISNMQGRKLHDKTTVSIGLVYVDNTLVTANRKGTLLRRITECSICMGKCHRGHGQKVNVHKSIVKVITKQTKIAVL